jgi:nucleoid-associated protein YgaU
MPGTSLTRASIMNLDKGGHPIECMFNPNEYTFTKQNSWTQGRNSGSNVPQLEFGGGQPATLRMQLFFDTYSEARSAGEAKDVRKQHTDAIWELMMVDESLKDPKNKKGRPPRVRFLWGKTWLFDAVITSVTQKFTLFLPDGTPVRATLDVSFQQIKDERQLSPQNPTSGGPGAHRRWTVREGDNLAWIAYRVYGDPNQWRQIADANKLTNVRRLTPGRVLVIPHG